MPQVVRVVVYECAEADCGATWRILPRFLAGHLWRVWKTVERVALPGEAPPSITALPIPERTRSRSCARREAHDELVALE